MPHSAKRPCTYPNCPALVSNGSRCKQHPYPKRRSQVVADYSRLYKTARWAKLRIHQLKKEPLCADCMAVNIVTQATVADHKTPHKGDPALFYDGDNLRSLCKRCHDRKTASQDGGFGNKRGGAGQISTE